MKNGKNTSVSELRTIFKGNLIAPSDAEYDKARTVFYGDINKKPAVIVQAADAEDVKKVINMAKTGKMELAVRSGGHSPAGHSVSEGGIVIDLRHMRKLEFDVSEKTVWAETGLTAAEVTTAADKHNLVIGFGDTGSVGIGGITLAGGIGFLVRKFGLTIDNLLAAEIVTADGERLQLDTSNHSDLFWAIRGGGGNFGVVTRLKYQLHEISDVYGGLLLLPATAEVISGFVSLAEKAPDELSAIISIMPAPPMPFVSEKFHGMLSVLALIMYAGDPEQGEKAVAPLRALAEPMANMLRTMRYKDIFFPEEDYHPTAVGRNMYMKYVDLPTAETIINGLRDSDAAMRVVQLRVLGGASSRINPDATAYAHRNSRIMCNVAAFYQGEIEKQKRKTWVDQLSRVLYQGDDGAYVGFLGAKEEDRLRNVYPDTTLERLTEIKNRYDHNNLFCLNHNISPKHILRK